MLAKLRSMSVLGIDAYPIEIEADITEMLPSFTIVGLPDGAVRESRERVMSAIKKTNPQITFTIWGKYILNNYLKSNGRAYATGAQLEHNIPGAALSGWAQESVLCLVHEVHWRSTAKSFLSAKLSQV